LKLDHDSVFLNGIVIEKARRRIPVPFVERG
jgi:hypothetical protein